MSMEKTIFVTGGTGNQGGAVTRRLLEKGFKVKVLTRHPDSEKSQNLKKQNVQLVQGDLDQPETYRAHLEEVDGVFSVQPLQKKPEREIRQGKTLAKLAKENHVSHFIYSSVAGADLGTGIPHWEAKYEIEDYIKHLDLPYTILRPVSLYENFLIKEVKTSLLKGKLVSPVNQEVVQQFVSADDVGKVCAGFFSLPFKYLFQTITIASEQMDLNRVSEIFSEKLNREITYQKLPSLVTRVFMGKHLYKMFSWINAHGGVFLKEEEKGNGDFPAFMDLKQWIEVSFKGK
jgi:uncharacterized protein YbjT (DUF2867 family)